MRRNASVLVVRPGSQMAALRKKMNFCIAAAEKLPAISQKPAVSAGLALIGRHITFPRAIFA